MKSLLLATLTVAFVLLPAGSALAPPPVQVNAVHHVHMMFVAGTAPIFDPPVLKISPGDTVVFHSHDTIHTATAGISQETEPVETGPLNAFNTGSVPAGSNGSATFDQAGVYPYYCNTGLHRHLGMHAVIIVA